MPQPPPPPPPNSMHYYDRPIFTVEPQPRENTSDRKITIDDLSSTQRDVFDKVLSHCGRYNLTSFGGLAGSGKSTCIPLLSEALQNTAHTAFAAFTGKAATVMSRKLKAAGITNPGYVGTLHGLIYKPTIDPQGRIIGWECRKPPLFINDKYISRILIDEASMINDRNFNDLLQYQLPILLVGDHGQLPPVQGQSVLKNPHFKLQEIHRQAAGNPIIQLAHEVRETGELPRFDNCAELQFVPRYKTHEVIGEAYERLGLDMAVIVRTNAARANINLLPRDNPEPVVDDIVICLRNTPPVFNGMRGVIKQIQPCDKHWYHATIQFPDEGITVEGIVNRYQFGRTTTIESTHDLEAEGFMPASLPLGMLFDFGIAVTCHKYQGSSAREVILCPDRWHSDNPSDYGRWLYTAVTRAEQKLIIVR